MLPLALLNENVTVVRRVSQGRDSLNNPIYGNPTDGTGWNVIYNCLEVRLAFSSKLIQFAPEGERVLPNGVMYFNPGYVTLLPEDRVITSNGIEYIVVSVVPGYIFSRAVDHYECVLALP